MRLDKYLTKSAVGTRTKVHSFLRDGLISVNGNIVFDATFDIDECIDTVLCAGKQVTYLGTICYMFNKPAGCITARKDANTPTVMDYLSDINTEGIFPVGRLDRNTEGLLLLTNDGELDHRLMSPECHIEKTYFFWALGQLTDEKIELLVNGISIGCNEPITKPAKVQLLKSGSYSEYKSEIDNSKFAGCNIHIKAGNYEQTVVAGNLIISEGRKHQVKRMLAAVGCHIVYLKRIAIGDLILDDELKPGDYRLLNDIEIQHL